MIVSSCHRIRLSRLESAKPCPPGDHVRVDLGDTTNVTSEQAWRLRGLVAGAERVELSGSTAHQRAYLTSFLGMFEVDR